MSTYPIFRWDVVMFNNSTTKVPMIYIKPDLELKEFIENNSYTIVCEIQGTETEYDGKKIPGIVDKSCNVPNSRPNFCDVTGYYVVSLWANWYGYPLPDKLGSVKFYGLKETKESDAPKDTDDPQQTLVKPHTIQPKQPKQPKKSMKLHQIILLVCMLILLILIIWFLTPKNYKSIDY